MIEGLRMFINYTNQWKGDDLIKQSRLEIDSTPSLSLDEIKNKSDKIVKLSKTRGRTTSVVNGAVYKPKLPKPENLLASREYRISFKRPKDEVELVSEYLYGDDDHSPSTVGNKCFEIILDKAEN